MRKNNITLRFLYIMLLSIVTINTNAQTGLNFQGVARTSNNVILASQGITIKLSILKTSATGAAEYTEIRKVTTNAQGLFTAVIGDTGAISTLGNFNNINWKLSPKFLKIEMDPAAGNNFITMGTTQFQYVAYAQFAKSVDAENIVGILPVSKGGTGLSTIAELKSALALDKINNTADADKPISIKTQTALDLIAVTATDTTRFLKRINSKADTSDVSDINKTLGTKLNAADTIKFTKQTYSDSSLLTKLKISDTSAMLSSRIKRDTLNLSNRINSKANTTDLSLGLELKESISNKSTASDLGGTSSSDVLFPTQKAVKEYVAANAGSGGVADAGITNIKLADGAVTYAKFQSIPTNTILGNTSSSTTSVQAIATTGSDNVVLASSPTITSPILITPNIGVATATSINDVIINGFNFKSDLPSLTITGTTTLQGNNTGDNATNTKYEGLLTYGAVDLITDQAIDGKKTFLNNIIMANLLGAGSITPTTINFANGSKIGDIQNINEDNPDADGSIDLYAPDGAKWVQLNYDDINYIGLGYNRAFIEVGGEYWRFNKTGTTDLPGDLNFTDNHAINFKSTGISTPTTNASVTSQGPLFKIQTREVTETEYDEDLNYGIELNYGDRNYLELREYMYFLNHDDDDSNEDYWSAASFSYNNFDFLINNNLSQYQWQFKDDGSTELPGTIKINSGNANFGLTINSESSNSWGSGIEFKSSVDYDTPYKGLFQLDGEGSMVFRTLQNGMYFDNFGNGNINFRVGTEGGNISGMILDNLGKLAVHGTVSSAGTNLTSDIRLKKNITPLQNSISIIQKLNPVTYDKKMNLASLDYSIKENGFIAQELQKILPNLVHESSDKDKLLSVNYTAIIPILTKGIQEQQVIIEDQKKRLEALEKLVIDLINKK
jgi:hypothetical protein